jgi:Leucine-rich repeat (LRR) protein
LQYMTPLLCSRSKIALCCTHKYAYNIVHSQLSNLDLKAFPNISFDQLITGMQYWNITRVGIHTEGYHEIHLPLMLLDIHLSSRLPNRYNPLTVVKTLVLPGAATDVYIDSHTNLTSITFPLPSALYPSPSTQLLNLSINHSIYLSDMQWLETCSELRCLTLVGTSIQNWSFLGGCINLRELSISSYLIENVNILEQCVWLHTVTLDHCGVVDLEILKSCESLKTVTLNWCHHLTVLPVLSQVVTLSITCCYRIQNYNSLAQYHALTTLCLKKQIGNTTNHNLDCLGQLSNLHTLRITCCDITEIPCAPSVRVLSILNCSMLTLDRNMLLYENLQDITVNSSRYLSTRMLQNTFDNMPQNIALRESEVRVRTGGDTGEHVFSRISYQFTNYIE